SNGSYLAVRVVQMALGLGSALLLYFLGRALWNRWAGVVAAGLMTTYWAFIYYEGEINQPPLYIFLYLLAFLLCFRWNRDPRFRNALPVGIVLGCASLVRPETMATLPLFALWGAWTAWRRGMVRSGLVWCAVVLGGAGAVISPVTIRNYLVSGAFVPISYTGELNLYMGNSPGYDGYSPATPDIRRMVPTGTWGPLDLRAAAESLGKDLGTDIATYAQWKAHFASKTWANIKSDPTIPFRMAFKRALLTLGPREVDENKVIACEKQRSRLLRHLPGFPWPLGLFVLGMALYGTRAWRPGGKGDRPEPTAASRETAALILVWQLAYFGVFLPLIAGSRYRIPLIPIMFLFGGYGVYAVANLFAVKRYRAAG
ncbi:MAG TPA: glycosyltransferase family 39 protein, partial [Candidatus Hydrogenedentes bacterium]|nr:glycosyltransferase family 39 protein [Candidatus Hydrogenedentota bacterium]